MSKFLGFSLSIFFFAAMLSAQNVQINRNLDRANAWNTGATSPPSSEKTPLGMEPDEVVTYLVNVSDSISSDFYKNANSLLDDQGAINQIGEAFPIDFMASRDFPLNSKRAGDRFTWATPITSVSAYGLRLKLDLSNLDKDDEVYLVDSETLHSFGPYKWDAGEFWGPMMDGDTTIVMLVSRDEHFGDFYVPEGSHIYRASKAAKVCEDDLNCENATWRNVATSVGHYSFVQGGSTYVCTGTLLNAQDGSFTPYFLTANHCVGTQTIASTIHVYWDYRSTSCNSGVGVNKSTLPQTTGGTLRATSSTLDATLVQLPNSGGSRHFAAWNATALPAVNSSVTGIHHPAGDFMRVSKGTIGGTGQTSCGGSYVNEYRVNWIDSLTEGGSSGSAIFNSNYEVIGDESGCGPENCSGTSAPNNYDWYSSLYNFYPQIQQYIGSGTPPATSALANGVSKSFNLATGATVSYTIAIPANATNLTVAITGSGDADLYVKRATINWPADQGSHNDAEFKAPYASGSSESVNFPTPAQATWNVLVHGYSASAGSITATWTVGGSTPTWSYVTWVKETPHNYLNSKTYTYTYEKVGAQQVGVHFTTLNTEANYDFLRVKDSTGATIFTVSGNLIASGSGSAFGRTDGWAIVNGSKITIELITDSSVVRYGFKTDQAAYYQ